MSKHIIQTSRTTILSGDIDGSKVSRSRIISYCHVLSWCVLCPETRSQSSSHEWFVLQVCYWISLDQHKIDILCYACLLNAINGNANTMAVDIITSISCYWFRLCRCREGLHWEWLTNPIKAIKNEHSARKTDRTICHQLTSHPGAEYYAIPHQTIFDSIDSSNHYTCTNPRKQQQQLSPCSFHCEPLKPVTPSKYRGNRHLSPTKNTWSGLPKHIWDCRRRSYRIKEGPTQPCVCKVPVS